MVRASESKYSKPLPYTTPFPEWGVAVYVFYYRNRSNLTYIAPKSKVKTIVGQVSFFEENCEFLFLTRFRRTDPILEKKKNSNFHTHSDFSEYFSK
jgi:hypothetical protein